MVNFTLEQSLKMQVKVKQFLYRPGQALRVPGVWASQISRQSAHEGGKVVSPTHRPPLPPRKYSWYSFLLRGWVNPWAIVRPKGLSKWKILMTPSGIEPSNFRPVPRASLITNIGNNSNYHYVYIILFHIMSFQLFKSPLWIRDLFAKWYWN